MSEDRAAGRGKIGETYPVASRVRGKVVAVLKTGYLVAIEDGVEGSIAFSDPSLSKVVNPSKILEVGDEVEAIVSELDMDQRRLSLSLRQVIPSSGIVVDGG